MYLKMFKKKAGMTDMIKIVFQVNVLYLSEAIEVLKFKFIKGGSSWLQNIYVKYAKDISK